MKRQINYLIVCIGAILILAISVVQGFEKAFLDTLSHLFQDLTKDLINHIYIGGVILIVFGVYRILRFRQKQ